MYAIRSYYGDYIVGLIDQIASNIHDDGTETMGKFRFLDWPSTPNKEGVEAGYRALLIWALKDAYKLCEILKEKEAMIKCNTSIDKLKRKILDPNELKQAAALMAIAGLIDPLKACNDVIAVDGAARFSTFYGLYMLDALSMAGMYDKAFV